MLEPAWIMGLLGGLLIGGAGALFLLVNGRIMGASSIAGDAIDGSDPAGRPERLLFLAGLVAVPWVIDRVVIPVDPHASANLLLIAVAGLLVGVGTRMANGCTSGHGVCGISRLSPRGMVATAVFIASGIATVALLRHGWGLI